MRHGATPKRLAGKFFNNGSMRLRLRHIY